MICLLLIVLLCMATYINRKLNQTSKRYMWVAIAIVGLSSLFIIQRPFYIETFQNNNDIQFVSGLKLSEPNEGYLGPFDWNPVTGEFNEDDSQPIFWDINNNKWVVNFPNKKILEEWTHYPPVTGPAENAKPRYWDPMFDVDYNNNNDDEEYDEIINASANNTENTSMNNSQNIQNIQNSQNTSMNNTSAPLSEKNNNIMMKNDVEKILSGNHKKTLKYMKALQSPQIPNVAQYGTKGISNIFTPKIMIRKKQRGNMSYNDARDSDESFPDINFEVAGKKGKIVSKTKMLKDWQKPTHNLWKGSMNNLPADKLLYDNHNSKYEGPYYWDEKTKKITEINNGGQKIYWDIEDDKWVDSDKNVLNIPANLNPLNLGKDPLNNVKENMQKEQIYKKTQEKGYDAYLSARAEDDEVLVEQAIKNNTWKQVNPGYQMVDPNKWNVPQKRPPVCLSDKVKLPSAVFTNGTPVNVLEFDKYGHMANTEEEVKQTNVGSILPKFTFSEIKE